MTSEVVCLGARTVVKGRSMTSEVMDRAGVVHHL